MTSKVVLITGASSGIGLATAELLHEAGFIVYGTSRRTNNASKYKFHLIELDVNHDDSVNHAIEKVLENEGRIDVLINNAGFAIAPLVLKRVRCNKLKLFLIPIFLVLSE